MNLHAKWLNQYFDEVSPREFYRAVFPEGELDKRDAFTPGKYTGILVAVTDQLKDNGRPKVKRYSVTDDLDTIDQVCKTDDFCLMSPISYVGKKRTAEAARYMYGIAIDVDRLRISTKTGNPTGIDTLWNKHIIGADRVPRPTYIVASGSGIHLYYLLSRPVAMFGRITRQLQKLKHELTELCWNEAIVDIKHSREIQQEGIYQGFRVPGTITKNGERARVFETGEKVSIEDLNCYVSPENRVTDFEYKPKLTRKEAAAMYPEWYERRILKEQPRNYWNVNRAVYEWWKQQITKKAQCGHRYYCMLILAMLASKCSRYDEKHNPRPVIYEELERDAFAIAEVFEGLTNSESNHFTSADVIDALEGFEDRWNFYPRETMCYRSGIDIPKNKRNGLRQAEHLEVARTVRDIRSRRRGEAWDAHNGRKSKKDIIVQWRNDNPTGRKADCIRDTGCDRKTVSKWW